MTILNLFETLLRKLQPEEVDYNFKTLRDLIDRLGGFFASQTPGANQIITTNATGGAELNAVAGQHLMLKLNATTDKYAQVGFYEAGVLKWNLFNDYTTDAFSFGNGTGTKFLITSGGNALFGITSDGGGRVQSRVVNIGDVSLALSRTGSSVFNFVQGVVGQTGDALQLRDATLARDYITLRNGNVLVGSTTDNGSGAKLQVNGSVTTGTTTATQTASQVVRKEIGSVNTQGISQVMRVVKQAPVMSLGTKLIIPFVSQGNLNHTAILRIFGHSARYNTASPGGFSADISVGCPAGANLNSLVTWNVGGNIASIALNGLSIEVTFTTNYTSATADGIFVCLDYMAPASNISVDTANIRMN